MQYKTDLDKLRHSCSHVMAQAVKEIWPEAKVTIGPAIDDGFYYDFDKEEPFSDEDLKKIEKRMQKIINKNPNFTHSTMKRDEAIKLFKDMKEDYKVELIESIGEEEVSIYKTGEDFLDLCKGPHVENAGQIKAFKLLSVAGSYWRGDEKNAKLQRIYGTCFFSKEELQEYLKILEEAQKRDHRKLGVQLDFFNFYHEAAGAGLVFYHPPGAMLRKIIEDYVREKHLQHGYELVMTPHILKGKLWEQSGHAEHYRENMYYFNVDEEEYAVKPMNCPGHMLIYKSKIRSYRDMPVRFFELGTVYRQEKAGVLHGLLRVRGFTQDDAHIFCREDQIQDEVMGVIDFVFEVMKDFGFENMNIELSTRPENYIGSLDAWDTATKALESSLKDKKLDYQINEGDGAFYGPKIDIKLKDALKREWQCATIQCDFSLPERFQLKYINEEGTETRPIMIHRAILGSIERFIGTLIEHYAGAFPVWLAPTQVVLIPINSDQSEFTMKVKEDLQNNGFRAIIDARNESLNKRIREATVKKVPYLLIIGNKEMENKTVSVRKYGVGDQGSEDVQAFINRIILENERKS
ncbi:MAG: threonine--tRNA ligase [Candidatus Omnitrophica bacterium]|nr:threonine--tRNA ligase [Candidatus Omnitrophota bacterium]MCB9747106.1 threonine--tRNA ligase [Candidatus Omnitrophota bacterium]